VAEEDSGMGFGTAALIGGGIGALVFRRNIGKFAKDYFDDYKRVTDPDALLKQKKKAEADADFQEEYVNKFGVDPDERGTNIMTQNRDLVPQDKVDELVNPAPMTPGQVAQQEAKNFIQRDQQILADIKREVQKPGQSFTLGGQSFNNDLYGVGSVLYDAVARKVQTAKPMPVSFWTKFFKDKIQVEFTPFNRKVETVSKDEIADTNIAKFDKKGNLVDGYLKYVSDMNINNKLEDEIRISPLTILNLIKKAPANNLRVIEYDSRFYAEDATGMNNFGKAIVEALEKREPTLKKTNPNFGDYANATATANSVLGSTRVTSLLNLKKKLGLSTGTLDTLRGQGYKMSTGADLFNNPGVGVRDLAFTLKKFKKDVNNNLFSPEGGVGPDLTTSENFKAFFDLPVSSLNYKGKYKLDPNMTIGEAIEKYNKDSVKFRDTLKEIGKTSGVNEETLAIRKAIFDMTKSYKEVSKLKNKLPFTMYPDYIPYRLYGPEDYFEAVIHVDPATIKGVKNYAPNFQAAQGQGHYHNDIFGQPIQGQILHLRGGIRKLDSNAKKGIGDNETILTVDEIQADINQKVQQEIKREKSKMAKDRLYAELDALRNEEAVQRDFTKFKDEGGLQRFQTEERRRQRNRNAGFDEVLTDIDNMSEDAKFLAYKKFNLRNLTDKEFGDLTSTESRLFGKQFLFDDDKEQAIRKNMFNLGDLNSDMYKDRLLTIADQMQELTAKGSAMTRADLDNLKKLEIKYEDIRELIPSVDRRDASKYTYMPFYKKEQWGPLGLKYAIKKAAKDGVDWVGVNPYELVHHREGQVLGNLEFYGNYRGGGDISKRVKGSLLPRQVEYLDKLAEKKGFKDAGGEFKNSPGYYKLLAEAAERPVRARKALSGELNTRSVITERSDQRKKASAEGATLPNFLKKFAADYGTEVKTVRAAKSDPDKPIKIIKPIKAIDPDTGKEFKYDQHVAAFTKDEYDSLIAEYGSKDNVLSKLTGVTGQLGEAGSEFRPRVVERSPGKYYYEDYYEIYALKVKPEFGDVPIKGYFKGGLAQNIFKW